MSLIAERRMDDAIQAWLEYYREYMPHEPLIAKRIFIAGYLAGRKDY